MKHRLVTRSDFDGLVCAVLLRHLDLIDDIEFVHPKDVQDGIVEITGRDILTNLPYAPGGAPGLRPPPLRDAAHRRRRRRTTSSIPDAAVGGPRGLRPLRRRASASRRSADELMRAVDQADSADYDARRHPRPAGLDAAQLPDGQPHRPRSVPRLPDLELPADDAAHRRLHPPRHASTRSSRCRTSPSACDLYREQTDAVRRAAAPGRRASQGDVVVVDLRDEEIIHAGNRFMVYALFPRGARLGARDLGPREAEHRDRRRQVDPRPHLARRHRRGDARATAAAATPPRAPARCRTRDLPGARRGHRRDRGADGGRLAVVAHHVVDRRLIGGRPPRELWRRRVL